MNQFVNENFSFLKLIVPFLKTNSLLFPNGNVSDFFLSVNVKSHNIIILKCACFLCLKNENTFIKSDRLINLDLKET